MCLGVKSWLKAIKYAFVWLQAAKSKKMKMYRFENLKMKYLMTGLFEALMACSQANSAHNLKSP